MKKKLTTAGPKELFTKLNKADNEGSLLASLRLTDSYIKMSEFVDFYNALKEGKTIEVSNSFIYLLNKGIQQWENNTLANDEITLTVKGFNHIEEAQEFCSWYSGQGEQDASIWFECRKSEGEINTDFMACESTTMISPKHIQMVLDIK